MTLGEIDRKARHNRLLTISDGLYAVGRLPSNTDYFRYG